MTALDQAFIKASRQKTFPLAASPQVASPESSETSDKK